MIYGGREFNFSSISSIWNNLREKIKKLKDMKEKFRYGGKEKEKTYRTLFFRFILVISSKNSI